MKISQLIVFLLFFVLTACAQSGRSNLGRQHAEAELKAALSADKIPNVVNGESLIIKDSITAIAVAEPILFDIYGKDNITRQKPYEVYLIETYWILTGTLPKGWDGGTFLIIIDARDSRVLRIMHGK